MERNRRRSRRTQPTKLTDDVVRRIRDAPQERGSGQALAALFDVHPGTITKVRARAIYKHVP